MSLNMGGDFSLDLYDMPQYPGLDRPTSVSDGGKSVKSNNTNLYIDKIIIGNN